jgi:signal peptidase I
MTSVFRAGFKFYEVSGNSMEPTVNNGDLVLANTAFYRKADPSLFDMVIIKDLEDGGVLMKRIIGTPGDKIEIRGGYIYRNDKKVDGRFGSGRIFYYLADENRKILKYWNGPQRGKDVIEFADQAPFILSENNFFYIGDHREISAYGIIHRKDMLGKVVWQL